MKIIEGYLLTHSKLSAPVRFVREASAKAALNQLGVDGGRVEPNSLVQYETIKEFQQASVIGAIGKLATNGQEGIGT